MALVLVRTHTRLLCLLQVIRGHGGSMLLYWWWFGGSVGRGSCGGSYSGSCGSLVALVEQLVVALGQCSCTGRGGGSIGRTGHTGSLMKDIKKGLTK